MQKNILCSWSGGKDSCFALMQAIEQNYLPTILLNVLNEEGRISRSHGIPKHILEAQSAAIQLPIHTISSSWNDYEKNFIASLSYLKEKYAFDYAVFGDIDLQPHREWEEKVCAAANVEALLPLWQQDRRLLVTQMLNAGIETMIVSCNATMGERFIGKILTLDLITELESMGIDACGENGEFHTLVLNCPLFKHRIEVIVKEAVNHQGYWFSVLA
jgi:uncharacterized protein (TIGR00290 family)